MTALLFAAGLLVASPQGDARPAQASVSGAVREAGSGAAIPNARVTIEGPGVRQTITADPAGRFAFAALPPGLFALSADREGFAFDRATTPRIVTIAGQTTVATIEMVRGAIIVGDVRDHQGNPRSGVAVHVLRRVASGGTETLPGQPPVTNDLGEFRVERVLPGDYFVLAAPPLTRGADTALMPTYYPGTIDQKTAQTVAIAPGQTASVSIAMVASAAFEIAGTVTDERGRPQRAMIAFVSQAVQTWAPGQSASTRAQVTALVTRADGTFRITGLGPGTYRLTPLPAPAAPPQKMPMDVFTAALNGTRSTKSVDVRNASVSGVALVLPAAP